MEIVDISVCLLCGKGLNFIKTSAVMYSNRNIPTNHKLLWLRASTGMGRNILPGDPFHYYCFVMYTDGT